MSSVTAFREERHLGPGATTQKARQRFPAEVAALEDQGAAVTVICMPLPKLQRFSTGAGSSEARFLYDYGWPDEVAASRVYSAGL